MHPLFDNDGSFGSDIQKMLKRKMAGEYSRELSVKVFAGQCRLIEHGYLTKLVGNADITRYLAAHHPEFLEEFRAIISAASLDQTASAN